MCTWLYMHMCTWLYMHMCIYVYIPSPVYLVCCPHLLVCSIFSLSFLQLSQFSPMSVHPRPLTPGPPMSLHCLLKSSMVTLIFYHLSFQCSLSLSSFSIYIFLYLPFSLYLCPSLPPSLLLSPSFSLGLCLYVSLTLCIYLCLSVCLPLDPVITVIMWHTLWRLQMKRKAKKALEMKKAAEVRGCEAQEK